MERVVGQVLRSQAEKQPDTPFVKCGGPWVTYGELDRAADRVAAGLAGLGVAPGDRVALIMPNRQELFEIFFGCARLGAVQVPLNYWLKGEFLRYQLSDCGASVLIVDGPGYRAAASQIASTGIRHVICLDPPDDTGGGPTPAAVEVRPYSALPGADDPPFIEVRQRDLFVVMYTSGTTGYPKGCMMTHGYYTAAGTVYGRAWVEPGDRIFTANPLFHFSGQVWSLMTALVSDASVCYEPQFSASAFMARAAAERATMLLGVGSMAMAILAQPEHEADRAYPFRMAAWIPLAPAKQAEFERRFNTPVTTKSYGQTEIAPVSVSVASDRGKADTAGTVSPHIDVGIADDADNLLPAGEVGEIVVRPREPDVMFAGYWNKPDATVEAFRNLWYHTGDYGRLDDAGYLTFVDRKKDALRRRGENVSSIELEAAILKHPKVAQVAVCAVPSSLGEDDIKACIVCAGDEAATPAELFDFFKSTLPYFAIPRYVEVYDELPVTATGRVRKHVLRDEGVTDRTWDLEGLGLVVERSDRRA